VSTSDRAELDSALNTVDDLVGRIAAMAERYAADQNEALASDLYEIERALQVAARRLNVVVRKV
jgi:hypothetical protein